MLEFSHHFRDSDIKFCIHNPAYYGVESRGIKWQQHSTFEKALRLHKDEALKHQERDTQTLSMGGCFYYKFI